MLNKLPFPNKLKNVPFYASCHHEHVNGKGYPNGLKGDEIPLPARIMCVADVWDAVTAQDRPYKPPTPIDKACEILKNGAKFGEFDKDVVDLFINEKDHNCGMKKSETMKKRALNVFFSQSKYISKNLHIPTETLLAEIKNAKGNQTCHGDLNPNGNILYDNDKNKFALIDFEDAFYGL